MIAITETGSDIVDLKECCERGIIVSKICGFAVNSDERISKMFLSLNAFMATMDINLVDYPLTFHTEILLNFETFRRMNKLAIVIKIAEGAVINEKDLCQAINEGMIAGAAIDVLSSEPPAQDHPYLKLLSRPNFILTPHVAWASTEAMQTLADQLIDNIENYVNGQPSNVVS